MNARNYIIKNFDVFETIFMILFALGMFSIVKEIKYAKYIFGATSALLTILYWVKATTSFEKEGFSKHIAYKITWYSLMLTPIAIYSKIQMYENSDVLLLIIIGVLILSIILSLIRKFSKKEDVKTSEIIRLFLATFVCFLIFALPLTPIK